jgi:quercetin dioxygenase-like cupin family protein
VNPRHAVFRAGDARYAVPANLHGHADGFRRWAAIGEDVPAAMHTGFDLCELGPGGHIEAHLHAFEQSVFAIEGEAELLTGEGTFALGPGDYALLPTGATHAWRNRGAAPFRWAAMSAPQPRSRYRDDTFFIRPVDASPPMAVDVRDPRMRSVGHIDPQNMDVARQTQDMLAVSASMRTALLVYSGITVKMMVDTDLGAQLHTMFMVQYQPNGFAGRHDHPFEETYLIAAGEVDAVFDGSPYRLTSGDIAWAGVGCVHEFSNPGPGTVRWLETQAPAPPPRHSYRFGRDWDYLQDKLAAEAAG